MKCRSLVCFLWPALLGSLALAGEKGETQPVIIREVQPEYPPDLEKAYTIDPVQVELTVDEEGKPFSLTAKGALPDNVVRAISQWRYRPAKVGGRNVGFRAVLTVPTRRPLTQQSEKSLRRMWQPATKELSDLLKTGAALDAAGAAQTEQNLDADPEATESRRITLLAYYANAVSKGAILDDTRTARARHLAWLVQNHPDASFLGSPLAIINATGEPLADSAGYDQIRRLWLNQLRLQPESIQIAEHATNFLRVGDPDLTEQALAPWVGKNAAAVVWLGDLYGLAALGVTSLDPKTGFPSSAATQLPESPFARRARAAFSSTNDTRVLFSGLAAVSLAGRALAKSGNLPAGYMGLCEELLSRAKQVFPETAASCGAERPLPEENKRLFQGPVQRIRVGGPVQQANLIKQPRPMYPQDAKARHIEGAVRFNAIIGKDGKIQSLILISGTLPFYESARAAVLQWEYKPTLLNGEPVEVATVIDVNYALSGR